MLTGRRTLTQFLIAERRRHPGASGDLNALILNVSLALKAISRLVARGSLGGEPDGVLGESGPAGLIPAAEELFLRATEWSGNLAGMVSAELADPRPIPTQYPRGKYLLLFDALDGASKADINAPMGSLFSILRAPRPGEPAAPEDFLQPGSAQICAGYALYGPTTVLVLTVGTGAHGFTLDPLLGEFILTHPDLKVPAATSEFAINASNNRHWEPAVKRYVDECLAGTAGARGREFSMRWIASLVAEAHRIMVRGGVFLSPRTLRQPPVPPRLHLLYEVNPIAFLMEQAGGLASSGQQRLLDVVPTDLHQRIGCIFGSREEVERLERYHRDHNLREYDSPLFGSRGLFRGPSSV